jgi:hypothetical protein
MHSSPADRIVPLIVATALFMENMDSTVIATSLPAIAQALGINPLALKLAVTSYLLSLAICIPASGWTADRFGTRNVFRAVIGVFVLGSIGCAASHSLDEFVLAHIVQGAGGSMMTPVGRLIMVRSIDKRRLSNAMAPGAGRTDLRTAARRLHHDLCVVALDLLDQCADWARRHGSGVALYSEYPHRAARPVRLCWLFAFRLRHRRIGVRSFRHGTGFFAPECRGIAVVRQRDFRGRLPDACPAHAGANSRS